MAYVTSENVDKKINPTAAGDPASQRETLLQAWMGPLRSKAYIEIFGLIVWDAFSHWQLPKPGQNKVSGNICRRDDRFDEALSVIMETEAGDRAQPIEPDHSTRRGVWPARA